MAFLTYHNQILHAEDVPLPTIAQHFGTPCYVMSQTRITNNWQALDQAFNQQPHSICYSVKANGNLSILRLLNELGSGFDVVSVGELERVIAAGGNPHKVVFSGVGKQPHEIRRALEENIKCLNVESMAELHTINTIAHELGKHAPISIRVNPNIDAKTHPYISTGLSDNKFGIPIDEAENAYLTAQSLENLIIVGIDCHIGSQVRELEPFAETAKQIRLLIASLRAKGITFEHVDLGGGLGINYHHEESNFPSPQDYIGILCDNLNMPELEIIIEPGRSIVGNAGVLITQVIGIKPTFSKTFAIVDAAMNDLIRPALYQGWHDIVTVKQGSPESNAVYDVVGPVCESADFLGHERPLNIEAESLLAICDTGAYTNCMASNYNTRPRAAEVLVHGEQITLIKPRESIEDLLAGEKQCL